VLIRPPFKDAVGGGQLLSKLPNSLGFKGILFRAAKN